MLFQTEVKFKECNNKLSVIKIIVIITKETGCFHQQLKKIMEFYSSIVSSQLKIHFMVQLQQGLNINKNFNLKI